VGGCGGGGWAVATLSVKAGAGSRGLCASRGQPPAEVGRPPARWGRGHWAQAGVRPSDSSKGGAATGRGGSRRHGCWVPAGVRSWRRGHQAQGTSGRGPAGLGTGGDRRGGGTGLGRGRGRVRVRGREKGNLVILSILKAHVSATSAHN
jgi:hypothetical protein